MKFGLDRKYFTSEEIYRRESDRIFRRHWLCALRSDEIAVDSLATMTIESTNVLLIRTADSLRAFHNVCRHRGAVLCSASTAALEAECITCPYHAWAYETDGRLRSAPNMASAPGWNKEDFGLIEIACAEWNGYVFVNLDVDAPAFESAFADVLGKFDDWQPASLVVGRRFDYEVKANWKLIFQNYSECYHCPTVHPALNRLSPYRSANNDLTAGAFLGGPMLLNEGVETMSTDGRAVSQPIPSLSTEQHRQVGYYTLFPTMFFSPHPDYVLVHRLYRIDVDRTDVRCELLFHPATDFDAERAAEFWDQTNRQDWHVCELTQAGANSAGFIPGPYSPNESVLPLFDEHYLAELGND